MIIHTLSGLLRRDLRSGDGLMRICVRLASGDTCFWVRLQDGVSRCHAFIKGINRLDVAPLTIHQDQYRRNDKKRRDNNRYDTENSISPPHTSYYA